METTKIQWTDHTFNPWTGCAKVADGCKFCYAEVNYSVKMRGVKWGPNGTRVLASDTTWGNPIKWNRAADKSGVRARVFCASLADVFEDWQGEIRDHKGDMLYGQGDLGGAESPITMVDVRRRLFSLIDATPHLDWQLLTKRPENIRRMTPPCSRCGGNGRVAMLDHCPVCDGKGRRNNVWLGTSIATQTDANRNIPELLKHHDLSPVLFVSAEPLLGPISLKLAALWCDRCGFPYRDDGKCTSEMGGVHVRDLLSWVIVGGESGPKARPCNPQWIKYLKDQAQAAGVPVFVKQMGSNVITRNDAIEDTFNNGLDGWPDPVVEDHVHGYREEYQGADCRIRLRDSKGGDMDEWPASLRVREFPGVCVTK